MKERYFRKSSGASVTELRVPPDAERVREFEVYCRLVVSLRSSADAAHGMRVDVNGSLKWSRRIATSNPGQTDSLDYRFRAVVPVAEPLRISVSPEMKGCAPVELLIEVDEE
jgi:hypothetical protein